MVVELTSNQKKILGYISNFYLGIDKLHKDFYIMDCFDKEKSYEYVRGDSGPYSEKLREDLNFLIHINFIIKEYDEGKILLKVNPDLVEVRGIHKYSFLKKIEKDMISHILYQNSELSDLEIGDWYPLSDQIIYYFQNSTLFLGKLLGEA